MAEKAPDYKITMGSDEDAGPSNAEQSRDDSSQNTLHGTRQDRQQESQTTTVEPTKHGFRFYGILVAVAFTGLLTALEATITSTALQTIVADLGGGSLYIWGVDGYLLAMTALQPLFGQLANVFGRRWPMITATALFVLGSGVGGGADSMTMLIAGRVIQGLGAGSINVLCEIIVCDMVPLRERGTYLAGVFGMISLGTALGPFFGGLIIRHTTWRWVFYLNLPIGGVALVLLVLLMHTNYRQEPTLAHSLARIDWGGNVLFVASITSMLIGLTWAGSTYSWSAYQVLVPLILGLAGLAAFLVYEGSGWTSQPTMPLHLMSNRTSATAFILTLLHSIATLWVLYFLPVYFQGALGSDPEQSGVRLLPTILVLIPSAIVGGVVMSKTGRYRPLHYIGFALMVAGFGLLSLLDEHSSTGYWVGFQIVESVGTGLVIPTVLPAVLAPLTEADTALATATWSFLRSFGQIWGTTIAGVVFDNRFSELAYRITDESVRSTVTGGHAYGYATKSFTSTLSPETRAQFIAVIADSLRRTWQVAIAFAGLGFVLIVLEKEVPLRKELDTEFGVDEGPKKDAEKGVTV